MLISFYEKPYFANNINLHSSTIFSVIHIYTIQIKHVKITIVTAVSWELSLKALSLAACA